MISRLRAVAAVAVLAAAAATAVVVTSVGAEGSPTPAARVAPVAPGNLRATLTDTTTPVAGGLVRWTTQWQLRWDPVPGAREYVLMAVGPEGEASRPMRTVRETSVALSVAAGTTTEAARLRNRNAQAAYRATQLGLAVAAVFDDGSTGPRAPVVPVGSIPTTAPTP